MTKKVLSERKLAAFEAHLRSDEKSVHTMEKYLRDARAFCAFAVRSR